MLKNIKNFTNVIKYGLFKNKIKNKTRGDVIEELLIYYNVREYVDVIKITTNKSYFSKINNIPHNVRGAFIKTDDDKTLLLYNEDLENPMEDIFFLKIILHEIGHILQYKNGYLDFNNSDHVDIYDVNNNHDDYIDNELEIDAERFAKKELFKIAKKYMG